MKQLIARIVDALMPPDIKESGQAEELASARMLIFLQLMIFWCAVSGAIASLIIVSSLPTILDSKIPLVLMGASIGYASSMAVFRCTGHNVVSANILAFTFYTTIIVSLLSISGQMLIGCMLYLLALPFLVTLTANYISGVVWVVMVAMAPILLDNFGSANFELLFLGNWVALSLGLFIAIYSAQNYLNTLSQRVDVERSWLEFVAGHDSLTGASNRATFDRRLQESIAICKIHGTKAVLVYIDLDKFKPINDTYGHQAGDIVLKAVAERLQRLVRRSDIVARLGGDEFAILFDQCSPAGVQPVIDRMATVVSEPIEVSGNHLSVGCSLGVVVCPDDGLDAEHLAHKADERMYAAKRRGDSSRGPADPTAIRSAATQRISG
jgi:diguanylate cyclase (GGDEF)-like protein